MSDGDLSREFDAAFAARKELGDQYESALVRSFIEKVDREVDARVAERVGGIAPASPQPVQHAGARRGSTVMALGSVTLGIPVTAIITTQMHGAPGVFGVLISWGAIAVVNVAQARSRRS